MGLASGLVAYKAVPPSVTLGLLEGWTQSWHGWLHRLGVCGVGACLLVDGPRSPHSFLNWLVLSQ